MGRWKYFTDEESAGMTDDICFKRDRVRELYGEPIVQTCGYRSPEHNAAIGGVPHSAHTKGMAIDIRMPGDDFKKRKLAWALGSAGFRNVEDCPGHYHAATDPDVPQNVYYRGVDH
jgi:hypothetical protein